MYQRWHLQREFVTSVKPLKKLTAPIRAPPVHGHISSDNKLSVLVSLTEEDVTVILTINILLFL
jgi:hypothetical protein